MGIRTVKLKIVGFFIFPISGQTSVEIIVEHILRPQCSNSWILADLTDIVIIIPTIAL